MAEPDLPPLSDLPPTPAPIPMDEPVERVVPRSRVRQGRARRLSRLVWWPVLAVAAFNAVVGVVATVMDEPVAAALSFAMGVAMPISLAVIAVALVARRT